MKPNGVVRHSVSMRRSTAAEVRRLGKQIRETNQHGKVLFSRVVERLILEALEARKAKP